MNYVLKKNSNKLFMVIILFFVIVLFNLSFNNVRAVEEKLTNDEKVETTDINEKETNENIKSTDKITDIFDVKASNAMYKVSEDKLSYLPFVRYATQRILVDKEISGLGTMFSMNVIEVNSPMKGLQVLFANDTVRVNSNMEYAVIFATNNVIIEGTLDKPAIIFAGKNITIGESAVLNDDLICYSDSLTVDGKIRGSILGGTETATIKGNIDKDLRIQVTNINMENEKSILGNVYIETYNKELNLKDKYPNASIKYISTEKKSISYDVIINAIITCLLFTLVYIVINKKSKGKIFEIAIQKVKDNLLLVILSGTLLLIVMPFLVFVLILASAFGLYSLAVPALIIYIFGILVIGLLSKLIVGSLISNYMSKNYYNDKSALLNAMGTFCIFMSLYILSKLPYIGTYVTMLLVILAVGIVICYVFKNKKKENLKNN